MASNAVSQNTGEVIKLATNMISGLTALEQSLGITQVTAARLQTLLTGFTSANAGFNLAREVRQGASTVSTNLNKSIETWLVKARAVLVPYLGAAWNATWAAAGFTDASTAVPRTVGERFRLLGLIDNFLAENPSYEDANPKVNVTAAEAVRLWEESTAAEAALGAAETASGEKKTAREAALSALTDSMRMLIRILDGLLEANDPRWLTFGLNEPASTTTPAAPANLTVSIVEGPGLLAQCDPVPAATRYRWRTRVFGEKTYKLATSSPGPLAQFGGFTPGAMVDVIVQAVNGSAEGGASEPVRVAIPVASTLAQPVLTAALPTTTATNGAGEVIPRLPISTVQHLPGNGFSTGR
jgi:hypothetical protein